MKLKLTVVLIGIVATLCIIFVITSDPWSPDSPEPIISLKRRDLTTYPTVPVELCELKDKKIGKELKTFCLAVRKNNCQEEQEDVDFADICQAYKLAFPPNGGQGGHSNPSLQPFGCASESRTICYHIGRNCKKVIPRGYHYCQMSCGSRYRNSARAELAGNMCPGQQFDLEAMTVLERKVYDKMLAKCDENDPV